MINHFFLSVYHVAQHYGLAAVMLSMIIENIGIPFPTEVGYILAISLINMGKSNLLIVLTILTAGHVVGSLISYSVGRWGGNWLRRKFKDSERFNGVEHTVVRWYRRYGVMTVFLTRFIGYVRPWSSLVAGFADFPFQPFLYLTLLGSILFNIIALYGSWIFVAIWNKYAAYHLLLALGITLMFLGAVIYKLLEKTFKKNGEGRKE